MKTIFDIGLIVVVITTYISTICSDQIDESESLKYVTQECNHKLANINSIGKFKTFMEHYAIVANNSEKPKRGLLNLDKSLRKCYDLKEALKELEMVVDGRNQGVCHMSYIDKLVDFHSNYLLKRQDKTTEQSDETTNQQQSVSTNGSYIGHFFSLFAHSVALTCKSKLTERISAAQNLHDCSVILSQFITPLMNENRDENQNDVSGVAGFLQNFKRVEDFAPFLKEDNKNGPYFNVIVQGETIAMLNKLKDQCRQRAPYYTALFSPIAILAQLGYDIEESTSDSDDLNNKDTKVLKCWLATAQLCQGILRTHLDQGHDQEELHEDQKKLVAIRFGKIPSDVDAVTTDSDSTDELINFNDTFDEIYPGVLEAKNKKSSLKAKMKKAAYVWAKNFLERRVDVEGKRNDAIEKFIGALTTSDNNGQDKPVAFNGAKTNHGLYNPATFITDDTDTFVQMATLFVSNKIKLVFSCVVAVVLSGMFVYLTLYAMATTIRVHYFQDKNASNFKAGWQELRAKRMEKIENKLQRKGLKDKLMVYKGH